MEVIILGANTLYSVFCFFKALLPKQVWSGMVGKGLMYIRTASVCTNLALLNQGGDVLCESVLFDFPWI